MINNSLFIAAIGASAGGHDALKEFFFHLQHNPNIAIVVLMHLHREHKSILANMISKYTSLEVIKVEKNCTVKPNKVYVLPEKKYTTLKNGKLILQERPQALENRSIDIFFQSLALEMKDKCLGIVLSSMGIDGTYGSELISGAGGKVLVQSPSSSQHTSMPKSAIINDHPSLIAPPSELAICIQEFIGFTQNFNSKEGQG